MDNEVTVNDLIAHSFDQQPLEFQNAFNTMMAGKLAAAIDNKKHEVAQSMFNKEDEQFESDTENQTQEEPNDGETA
jgi:hypothetical protein